MSQVIRRVGILKQKMFIDGCTPAWWEVWPADLEFNTQTPCSNTIRLRSTLHWLTSTSILLHTTWQLRIMHCALAAPVHILCVYRQTKLSTAAMHQGTEHGPALPQCVTGVLNSLMPWSYFAGHNQSTAVSWTAWSYSSLEHIAMSRIGIYICWGGAS